MSMRNTIKAKFLGIKAVYKHGINMGDFPAFEDIKTGQEIDELEQLFVFPNDINGSDFIHYFGCKSAEDYNKLKNQTVLINIVDDYSNIPTVLVTMKAVDGTIKTFEFTAYDNDAREDEDCAIEYMIRTAEFVTF